MLFAPPRPVPGHKPRTQIEEAVLATTPDLQEPQIAAARAERWRQAGDALLTLEAARTWLNDFGLLLFAARPALGSPAPSLVEATLGESREAPTLAEMGTARTLVARLVGEGSAIPLNLLGGAGDAPDFVVSAAAFPFVFTLRGDKGWKRPPETTGAVKVTPLALRVYELLTERGALPVAELVSEIGREVNESAVSRALSELWQLLRVLPVWQQGEGETRWELTTARFLKAVKAGANAGQPTALSALVSLYLHQALVATEEEIAGFLSPLTARSRVREVLHGLSAGRQITEGVLHGKTVLFVPDALPDFARFAPAAPEREDAGEGVTPVSEGEPGEAGPPPRIRRFEGEADRPQDRNMRGKPVRAAGSRPVADRGRRQPSFPDRSQSETRGRTGEGRPYPARAPRSDEGRGPGRPSRPPQGDRPSFTRPWDEERGSRPPRRTPDGGGGRTFGARADGPPRPPRDRGEGGKPPFKSRAPQGRPFGDRPLQDRPFQDRPFRDKPFRDRGQDSQDRPARPARVRGEGRPPFRGPKTDGDRPGFGRRPFAGGPREGGATGEGRDDRRPAPRGDRPSRPFRPRTGPDEGGPPKRPYRPRPEGGPGDRGGFADRAAGGAPKRPFRAREDRPRQDDRPRRDNRQGEGAPSRGAAGPPRTGFNRDAGSRPGFRRDTGPRPEGGGFAPRGRSGERRAGGPGGPRGFGGRPGGKPSGGPGRPSRPSGPSRSNDAARSPRKPRPEDEA